MKRRALALLVPVAFAFTRVAHAQTDPVTAQALFDEAKSLMAHGKTEAACPKLAESQRLDPGVGTLLNLGECYDKIGKSARAWSTFRDAEAMALREGQPSRAKYASGRATQVEAKLVRITVEVEGDARIPSLEVFRDGEVLREPLWGSAVPVDRGEHVVEARAPGHKTFSTHVTATHDAIVVRITPLEVEPPPPSVVTEPAPNVVEPPPPAIDRAPPVTIDTFPPPPVIPPEPPRTTRTAGLVFGSIGLASVATGAIFGVLAMDRDNSARGAGCGVTTCPTSGGLALSDDAKRFAVASDITFAIGGALLVTSIVLLVAAPRSPLAHVARAFAGGEAF